MVKHVYHPDFIGPEDLYAPKADQYIKLRKLGGGEMARRGDSPFERSIQSSIIEALNENSCTVVRCRSADSVGHIAGDPDITGCIDGLHIEIEVKVFPEQPEPLQRHRLKQWAKAGACCCWVTSKAQALTFQKEVLAGRGKGRVLEPSEITE